VARALDWLAHPLPRSWAMDLGEGARLEVLAFYPYARSQPFKPADFADRTSFPALAVELASPSTGVLPEQWLGLGAGQSACHVGPGLIELLGRRTRPEHIHEFQHPPSAQEPGKGTLVVGLAGRTFRWDVAKLMKDGAQPVGDTGWSVCITQYEPDFRRPSSTVPANPGLAIELFRAQDKVAFALTARRAGEMFPMGQATSSWQKLPDLCAWYHPPDLRYGDPSIKAVLQLLASEDGTIYYRSFTSSGASGFSFEKTGAVQRGAPRQRIWSGMGWKFRVVDHLPHAMAGPHFIPVARPLGHEDPETTAVIRCRLRHRNETREFWLGKTDGELTRLVVGDEEFLVGYNPSQVSLNFALRLARAEQTTDHGSSLPASQSSFVLLTDPDRQVLAEGRLIALN
jgi:hypothetical protein